MTTRRPHGTLKNLILPLLDGTRTGAEIAAITGVPSNAVHATINTYGMSHMLKRVSKSPESRAKKVKSRIMGLADGTRTSEQIAAEMGISHVSALTALRRYGLMGRVKSDEVAR